VNVVLLEWPPLGEEWVYWRWWIRRVFKMVIYQQLLDLGAYQKLDALDGISTVPGVGCHTGAQDADVHTSGF
jgi:hypothetical protein